MSKFIRLWLIVIVFLVNALVQTPRPAQSQFPEAEWATGIWENINANDIGIYLLGVAFLPDGQIRFSEYEGMTYGEYRWIDERHISVNLVWPPGYGRGFIRENGVIVEISFQGDHLIWSGADAFHRGPYTFRKIHNFTPENRKNCVDTLPSRVVKDFWGFVTYTDGSSSRLRTQPSLDAGVVASASEGTWFYTIGGPICANGYTWWQVEIKDTHEVGWMAEGDGEYYIDLLPHTTVNKPRIPFRNEQTMTAVSERACPGALPPRMVLNQRGQVTYTDGSSANLRAAPASPSILLAMPEGYEFEVTGGPECHNGLNWWQLRTPDGLVGWAAEGSADANYWIEPLAPPPSASQPFDLGQSEFKNQEELSCSSAFEPGTWVKFVRNPLDSSDLQYHTRFASPHFADRNFDSLSEYGMLYLVELASCDGNIPLWEVENELGGLRGYFPERDTRNDHVYFQVTEVPEHEFYSQYPRMLPLHWYCLLEGPGCGIGDADINPADGQWWCSNTERIGNDQYCGRVDLNDACRFIYGEVDGSPVRPIATQLDPNNPDSWQCQAQGPHSEQRAFVGADQPFAQQYAHIPGVINPAHLSAYASPDFSQTVGTVVPTTYYRLAATMDEWALIATPSDDRVWVPAWILEVGTVLETPEVIIDEIINNPASVATLYSYDQIPERYHEPRDYLLDRLGRDAGNAISYGYLTYELLTGTAELYSLLCTPVDFLSDYSDIDYLSHVDMACVAYDLVRGTFVVLRGGSPIGLYIVGAELVLDNLGSFIRWNDRVWMDNMNQFFGSCPLTRLFWGEEAGDYCSGFMR